MNTVLTGVLIYVVLQLVVGLLVSRHIANEADYLLAGRSLGYGLTTFTIFATWFGAETCISSAGAIYENGLSGGSADPFGYAFCILFMGAVFAAPLWKRKLTTLADLFRQRYSVGVERFAVLLMAPTSVFWAAAQIRAFGQVLDASSGIGVNVAITAAAAVVIIYTVFGGLRADVITDFIQGAVIIVGLIVVFVAVLANLDNPREVIASIPPERFNPFGGPETSFLRLLEAWLVPICGSVVAQELASRIIAARSPQVARRSALLGGGLYLLIGMIPAVIGLMGIVLVPHLEHPEQIVPQIAQQHLNVYFYILFIGALVSAILSTVDSTLLAASSLVSHNLILPLKPDLSERAKVRMARIGVAICGLLAYWLALHADRIYDLVESSSSFGSAGIFIIMVFGLFSKRGGAASGYAALISGLSVWTFATLRDWPYPFVSSLAAALVAYLFLSPLAGSSPN
jgi:solute:Na+ symporter, SSS family